MRAASSISPPPHHLNQGMTRTLLHVGEKHCSINPLRKCGGHRVHSDTSRRSIRPVCYGHFLRAENKHSSINFREGAWKEHRRRNLLRTPPPSLPLESRDIWHWVREDPVQHPGVRTHFKVNKYLTGDCSETMPCIKWAEIKQVDNGALQKRAGPT